MATTESRTGWGAPSLRAVDAETSFAPDRRRHAVDDSSLIDPLADEPRWAAWKVTVAVVVFCTAFWVGLGYLAMRLLG